MNQTNWIEEIKRNTNANKWNKLIKRNETNESRKRNRRSKLSNASNCINNRNRMINESNKTNQWKNERINEWTSIDESIHQSKRINPSIKQSIINEWINESNETNKSNENERSIEWMQRMYVMNRIDQPLDHEQLIESHRIKPNENERANQWIWINANKWNKSIED
jgi:hypothetical protein